jgi:hypothetical protein
MKTKPKIKEAESSNQFALALVNEALRFATNKVKVSTTNTGFEANGGHFSSGIRPRNP